MLQPSFGKIGDIEYIGFADMIKLPEMFSK